MGPAEIWPYGRKDHISEDHITGTDCTWHAIERSFIRYWLVLLFAICYYLYSCYYFINNSFPEIEKWRPAARPSFTLATCAWSFLCLVITGREAARASLHTRAFTHVGRSAVKSLLVSVTLMQQNCRYGDPKKYGEERQNALELTQRPGLSLRGVRGLRCQWTF